MSKGHYHGGGSGWDEGGLVAASLLLGLMIALVAAIIIKFNGG